MSNIISFFQKLIKGGLENFSKINKRGGGRLFGTLEYVERYGPLLCKTYGRSKTIGFPQFVILTLRHQRLEKSVQEAKPRKKTLNITHRLIKITLVEMKSEILLEVCGSKEEGL